jgi:hypothetical protein
MYIKTPAITTPPLLILSTKAKCVRRGNHPNPLSTFAPYKTKIPATAAKTTVPVQVTPIIEPALAVTCIGSEDEVTVALEATVGTGSVTKLLGVWTPAFELAAVGIDTASLAGASLEGAGAPVVSTRAVVFVSSSSLSDVLASPSEVGTELGP